MPDYDVVVVGSGFAGSATTLSFLEETKKAGKPGRVALIEAGKKGERAGASRWTMAYLRLNRDNTLSKDWVGRMERDCRGLADLDYCRTFEAEVPATVKFMEDHGVELIHHDEPNVALEFDEQHFVYPNGGGKAIVDAYFNHIEQYDTCRVFWEHEAIRLKLDDEGRVVGAIQWYEEDDPMYRHAGMDLYLDPAYHGKGLGTDAVRTLARHIVHDHGHHRITIDPAADNHAAIRCYSKVGFRPVGVMRRYERAPDGTWHDGLLMDLLAEELIE